MAGDIILTGSRERFCTEGNTTIVNSSFIGHALLDAYEMIGDERFLQMALPIRDFLLNDFYRTVEGDRFCFSQTVWDCKYHLVWTTKYMYEILGGDIGQRCRELLREIARAKEMQIYAGSINRDHVHMLSVSRTVQHLKGRVRNGCCRSTRRYASSTEASIYGSGAIE